MTNTKASQPELIEEVEELLARPDKYSDPFLAFRLLRRLVEEVKRLRKQQKVHAEMVDDYYGSR